MMSVSSFSRLNPAFSLFMSLSFLGIVMVVCSGGLLGVYVGFECSFLGLAAVLAGDSVEENEGCMKYFVFQALGSMFLLVGFVFLIEPVFSIVVAWAFTLVGLCLKAGFFPFHYWVPSVMATCSWFSCFLISVWQKIGLMCFIGKSGMSWGIPHWLEGIACLTALSGAIGGVWAVFYRSLMGYSSLVHSGWMIMACFTGLGSVLFYLGVYGVISGVLMGRLQMAKLMCYEDLSNTHLNSGSSLFMVFIDFMSLGGVPVLPGFIPKVVVLILLGTGHLPVVACLILASILSLYYYLKVAMVAGVGTGLNHYVTQKWGGTLRKIKASVYVWWSMFLYATGFSGLLVLVGVVV
uniref:NADH dehydrogenase subunit 2 n=1 Tax=Neoteredo reynei TaxID=298172 RepID=UPI00202870D8|nr:NADH dehydrogenase subunit 2 [Neoteredo reynei]UPX89270.1 NADH dehydrogenase subunit 2 [Neoteredo reynei]